MKPYIDSDGFLIGMANEGLIQSDLLNLVNTPAPDTVLAELEIFRFLNNAWIIEVDNRKGIWIDPLNTSDRFIASSYDTPIPTNYVNRPVISQEEIVGKASGFVFNPILRKWEDPRTLQDLKDAQWGLIKQARSNAEYAGFTWDGSVFDSDATSQNRITGAVTLAQLSTAFTIDWTLQDNTVRTLNAQEMCAVGAALGTHVQTQFTKGQALRAQIEAATTKDAVEAVVW